VDDAQGEKVPHGTIRSVNPRFLTLADVAETLNVSASQVYALVRSGELRAIKVGGRGQWRVEAAALEEWIARAYAQTEDFVRAHPFATDVDDAGGDSRGDFGHGGSDIP
jgi:excisionase family DNA binding protein